MAGGEGKGNTICSRNNTKQCRHMEQHGAQGRAGNSVHLQGEMSCPACAKMQAPLQIERGKETDSPLGSQRKQPS